MRFVSRILGLAAALALSTAISGAQPAQAQQTITLNGAVQFNDDHAFTKALVKFEELVKKYYGKPINFVLHRNSSLGLEKQYFEYMAQGKAVDYAIVSPAHMSTFSKAAPFIDAPFLFRDLAHWNKVLDADLLKPVADEINEKAEVMLIGYAGGGTRNIFVNKPLKDLQDAIIKAGKEAGAYGRQVESSEDSQKLEALEKAGKLKRVPFADRDAMKKLVDPVMAAYAREIGADKIFAAINALQ